jgi:hypothetical protein
MGDITIERENYKLFVMTLVSFIMLAACIAIAVYGAIYRKSLSKCLGITFSLVILIWFIHNVVRTKSPKPLLIIGRDGIKDLSGTSPVYISFTDVKEFAVVNIFGTPMIGVMPKDTREFLSKLSPVRQKVASERMKMKLPPFSIALDRAKDMSIEDIFSLLEKRFDDFSRLYD